jgi:hypothetical protein
MQYLPRTIEPILRDFLTTFPVVALTGPRQSGKSTLLQQLLSDYTYVTFDDMRQIALFEDDPERFMQTYADRIVFDEVQKVPNLFNYIKLAVDRDRGQYGKFVLTGSSQFLLMRDISESLAGRIGLLSLLPFDCAEIPADLRRQAVWRGAYPELVTRRFRGADDWYAAYMDTYISKDIRDLAQIGDLRDFRRLIQLLAAHTAQLLNLSRFASDLGVAVSTVKRWVSLLEMSYVIFLLPPYYDNFGKRIVKSPKVYFYDTGLVASLTGIRSAELYEQGPMAGSLFENFIVAAALKRDKHLNLRSEFYHYRTNHGVEIDRIIDRGTQRDFIEIKKSSTFRPRMIKVLDEFATQATDGATLIYEGEDLPTIGKVSVQNWSSYFS